jgi:hypothetical protein
MMFVCVSVCALGSDHCVCAGFNFKSVFSRPSEHFKPTYPKGVMLLCFAYSSAAYSVDSFLGVGGGCL